jgi:hypothetical protein
MTTLASIRTQIAAFNPTTSEKSEIKAVIAVYINAEPQIYDRVGRSSRKPSSALMVCGKISLLLYCILEKLFLVQQVYIDFFETIYI